MSARKHSGSAILFVNAIMPCRRRETSFAVRFAVHSSVFRIERCTAREGRASSMTQRKLGRARAGEHGTCAILLSDYDGESLPMVFFCALAHRLSYWTMSGRSVSTAVAHSGGTLVAAATRAVRPGRAARTIVSMVTPPPARRRKCRRQFGGSGELLPKIAQRRRPKRICRLL